MLHHTYNAHRTAMPVHSQALAVFARAPVPGRVKTRLIPLLGAKPAADFHAALLADLLWKIDRVSRSFSSYLFATGGTVPRNLMQPHLTLVRQSGADLGARLENAFRRLLRRHSGAVILGADVPLLSPRILRQALRELRVCDAVMGPSPDGGYYLIGLRRLAPRLFRGIRWGTRFAYHDTRARLEHAGYVCSILESLPDVDRPGDLRGLKRLLATDRAARRLAPAAWQFLKTVDVAKARNPA